ncbi:peptide chain release factor N(5)-glutamine methyltransferase [Jatrophihabitans telluris]|uniref:Release factor glutamine methyltransferase n=1 Tax=Jatrophihabitans telluris TaxID=2038343 RepID=A0ABY4R4S9_9ACTN|nr:peptide chain release factor N(5)-glutamine methyltransferase [Jatrophihabitans telluris]UQX89859.1 peptide chain release factor N(5)-glutamine methyltransferase [Jatrophihabitans telluris]
MLVRTGAATLGAARVASPRVDAELLLAHLLGLGRTGLISASAVTEEVRVRFQELIAERASGVPVQHLTGTAPFRHLQLRVGAGVFIPRPETELLVEIAADALAEANIVLDLCSGSGALALSIAQELNPPRVIAVERSAAALRWLRSNAADRAEAGDRPIQIIEADVDEPELLAELTGAVDVVVSNPPYVPRTISSQLGREIAFDPPEAVFAGPDGLALMPALFATAARLLRPRGLFAFEHDESHPSAVADLLTGAGAWDDVTGHRDLAGRGRFTSARRAG